MKIIFVIINQKGKKIAFVTDTGKTLPIAEAIMASS